MKIANIMLGGKTGGIEQALLDTSEALRTQGHAVTAFVRTGAAILPQLMQAQIPTVSLSLPYRWNLLGRVALGQRLKDFDIILLHGNRAGELTRGQRRLPPILAVVHSRFFKEQPHFSALIALSEERASALTTPLPVYVAPNMIRIPQATARAAFRAPPIIGAMGRLSTEKGFDLFIDALALLRDRGIAFRAILGGTGAEESALQKRITERGLARDVLLLGWVKDKAAFFRGIDIFVLPSRTENFPITVLEAFAHGCPTIATRCGAEVIVAHEENGLLADISAESIADALAQAIANPATTEKLGIAARTHAEQHYAMEVVGKQLSEIVVNALQRFSA